jgi:hypothetical protein
MFDVCPLPRRQTSAELEVVVGRASQPHHEVASETSHLTIPSVQSEYVEARRDSVSLLLQDN